ncbi:hypothetical protein F2Q68_00037415 [Brassica cretica]|uniref:UspA domain-containing protein n=1 Tax=Brassica cretica TaxID=69181 RepID=A0A8S9HAZ6_BRACR|nr:hypothetical protein F2Q68_00037415 [Brassica cretica]
MEYLALPPPSPSPSSFRTVFVALSGSRKSKYVVTWALEKFGPEGNVGFKLLHIHPRITCVPTPMGNTIPISEVREDVVTAYRQEILCQSELVLTPFKKMFEKRKVAVEVLVIESNNVAAAIAEEVIRNSTERLVIGSSSRRFFSRRVDLCSAISALMPNFCTVFVVSKGKLSSVRPGYLDANASIRDDTSSSSSRPISDGTSSARDSSSSSISLPVRRLQHLTTAARQASAQMETNSVGSEVTMCMSMDVSRTNKSSMDTKSPSTPGLRDNEERKKAMSSSSSNLEYGNATHSRSSQQASSMCDNISEQSYTSNQTFN